jgi:hypothetical protein
MNQEKNKAPKVNRNEYVFCSELIWGGVPVDTEWAIGTPLYKTESVKILEKYPHLDKSFFEINKQTTDNNGQ